MSDGDVRDIRIRRPGTDGKEAAITLAEWERAVAEDSDLEFVAAVWGRNPQTGEPMRVSLEGGVRWRHQPLDSSGASLWWEGGQIVGLSVSEATAARAKLLAARLSAQCIVTVD